MGTSCPECPIPYKKPEDRLRNVCKGMDNIKYAIIHLELAAEAVPEEISDHLRDAWIKLNESILPRLGGTPLSRVRWTRRH